MSDEGLSGKIDQLSSRVSELERLLREHVHAEHMRPSQAAAPPPPAPVPQPSVQPPPLPPPPRTVVPSPPAQTPRRPTSDIETEIGGNWLNKIGAVALVLGMAFFLKYAIDNRWINETARIIIGLVVGLLCVYGGEYFQKKRMPRYAQGVSGAGIAILYFTVFAAFAFYRVIPYLPAFVFMVVVTATAIVVAVRHDSVAIAVLGIIGGFATPVLLRQPGPASGESNLVPLFTYIAVLDLGILAVTYYRNWRALNILSLLGTVLVFEGWYLENYDPRLLPTTMAFLTWFYAIFAAQSLVQNVIARRPLNGADILLLLAAPVLYFGASYYLLADKYHIYLGLFAVAMAALYLLFASRVRVVGFEDKSLTLLYLAIAAGFLTIAIPIQLKQNWITIGWATEAAVLAAVGFCVGSVRMRYVVMLLFGLVAIRLLFLDSFNLDTSPVPFLNQRFGTFLYVIAMMAVAVRLGYVYREQTSEAERALRTVLVVVANFLLIWVLSIEVLAAIAFYGVEEYGMGSLESLSLSALWALYGVLLVAAGIAWRYRVARIMGVVVLGVVILKAFLYDVWTLERLHRVIAFVGLGIILFVASYVYQANRDRIRRFVTGGVEEHA